MNPFIRVLAALFFAGAPVLAQETQPIINGTAAPDGRWPWMAALYEVGTNPVATQFCGGALIARDSIVTAAHCLEGFENAPEAIGVLLGRAALNGTGGVVATAVEAVIHPRFDRERLTSDIGVIRLAAPVNLAVLDMVEPGDEPLWQPGSASAIIMGWGLMDPYLPILPNRLQQAEVPIRSDTVCADALGRIFDPGAHLCAGILAASPSAGNGVDSCNGDSGGPLIVAAPGGYKLAGIVSWGFDPCASARTYGVYTRLAPLADWVRSRPTGPPQPLEAPEITGVAAVGSTLSCSPGGWRGEDLTFSYRWYDDITDELFSDTATYVPAPAHLERYVYCEVTASNGSGSASNYSYSVGPIEERGVAAGPNGADSIPPTTSDPKVQHRKSRYTVTVAARDRPDYDQILRVDARVHVRTRSCGRKSGGVGSCAIRRSTFDVALRKTRSGRWRFSVPDGAKGRYRVRVKATDTAGNVQKSPLELRFTVH